MSCRAASMVGAMAAMACARPPAAPPPVVGGPVDSAAPTDTVRPDDSAVQPEETGFTELVTVVSGQVQGRVVGDLHVFRGVPYSQELFGDKRFRWSPPPGRWDAVLQATTVGPPCPQPGRVDGTEDCLYLDVVAPAGAVDLPVLVWFDGGDRVRFAPDGRAFDAAALAREGAVVVTFAHRLGLLGFLSADAVEVEGHRGNWALTDQLGAVSWVRDHIAGFGGDPERITLVGESSGAGAICALLTLPIARGLFARAILQSPVGCGVVPDAAGRGAGWLGALGCGDLPCLWGLPVRAFVDQVAGDDLLRPALGHVVDRLVGADPDLALRAGAAEVPVLWSLTGDDARGLVPPLADRAALEAWIASHLPGDPVALAARVPPETFPDPTAAGLALAQDLVFGCPAVAYAGAARAPWTTVVRDLPVAHGEVGAWVSGPRGEALRGEWLRFAAGEEVPGGPVGCDSAAR